ncbi:hypothetical protein SGPA1_30883 [Streptomyces misionensis JCM 4497]
MAGRRPGLVRPARRLPGDGVRGHRHTHRPEHLRDPAGQRLLLVRRHPDGPHRMGAAPGDAAEGHPPGRPLGGTRGGERDLLLGPRHLREGHQPGAVPHRGRGGHPGRLHHHPAVRQERLPQPEPDGQPQVHRGDDLPQARQQDEQGQDPRGLPQHQLVRPRHLRHPARRPGLLRQGRQRTQRLRGRDARRAAQGRRAVRPHPEQGQPPAGRGALVLDPRPHGQDPQAVAAGARQVHDVPRAAEGQPAVQHRRAERLPGGAGVPVRQEGRPPDRPAVRPGRLPDLHHLRPQAGERAHRRRHQGPRAGEAGQPRRREERPLRRRLRRHRRPDPRGLRRPRPPHPGLQRVQRDHRPGRFRVPALRVRRRARTRRPQDARRARHPRHPGQRLRRRRRRPRDHPRGPLLGPQRQEGRRTQRRQQVLREDHPARGPRQIGQHPVHAARHGHRPRPGTADRPGRRTAVLQHRPPGARPLPRQLHPQRHPDGQRIRHLRRRRHPHGALLGQPHHPQRRPRRPRHPAPGPRGRLPGGQGRRPGTHRLLPRGPPGRDRAGPVGEGRHRRQGHRRLVRRHGRLRVDGGRRLPHRSGEVPGATAAEGPRGQLAGQRALPPLVGRHGSGLTARTPDPPRPHGD